MLAGISPIAFLLKSLLGVMILIPFIEAKKKEEECLRMVLDIMY